VVSIGGSLLLFALRAPALQGGGLFAPISREGGLVLNNLLLATATATVFVGTLYPLFLALVGGGTVSVGAPFFNATFVPLMVPLVLAMAAGPLLAWKRADLLGALQRLWTALVGAAAVLAVGWWIAGGPLTALLGLALASWLLLGSLVELAERLKLGRGLGQAWQRAQAFLAACIASVDFHVIDMHRHPTESADGVHYEERAVCMCNALKLLKRLPESGRGFCYGGGEKFRLWMFFEGLFERFGGERLAQLSGEVDYFCACAFGDFHDLAAKEAQVAHDKRIALFEQVGEDGFSAGETGAGDAERHLILCLEYLAQQVRGLFQYGKKFWIDVAELRRGGDSQDTRVNVAWTRAEQQSVRGIDFGKCVLINFALPHYQLCHAFPFLFAER